MRKCGFKRVLILRQITVFLLAFLFLYQVDPAMAWIEGGFVKVWEEGEEQAVETTQPDFEQVFLAQGYKKKNSKLITPFLINESLSEVLVKRRRNSYNLKLSRWVEIDQNIVSSELPLEQAEEMVFCYRKLSDIISSYTDLYANLFKNQLQQEFEVQFIGVKLLDEAFENSNCGELLTDWDNEEQTIQVSADAQLKKVKTEQDFLEEAVERQIVEMAAEQALNIKWNRGQILAENEDYEDALAVFTEFLGTKYENKASKRIEDLSLYAAKEQRKNAANIFTRSIKTKDQGSREKLLMECLSLLEAIIEKYPTVDIIPKVRANIDRVEDEMESVRPGLLEEYRNSKALK